MQIVHSIDKMGLWHRLPVILGLFYLGLRRRLHQRYNLLNVGATPVGVRFNPVDYPYRTADGEFNDPFQNEAGSDGQFFGRNMLPQDQKDSLMKPDPAVVATKLLARKKVIDTGKQFNMIAASWIQFMVHDWIDHLEATNQMELQAPASVASQCPLKSFRFYKTKEVPTGFYDIKTGHINIRTPWWDGSAVYGSTAAKLAKVRTFKDGKLKVQEDGLLLHDEQGIALSGDVRNSWAGVSVLQALFILEHNAVCDALKKEDPHLNDEELYRHARLVTSAVIAKKFKDTFGHLGNPELSGFIGMHKAENHGVPYSLTEEFTAVYRMHSLLPDSLLVRNLHLPAGKDKSPPVLEEVPMADLVGLKGEKKLSEIGFTPQLVSMGHQACGALELWNYPLFLRDLIAQNVDGSERPDHVDMAALEVYRDRERGVARYNQFRRNLLMVPIKRWEDLTDDKEAIKVLREVYNDDVEKMDILADRFFTSYFNEETYTKKGLEWVNTTEGLKDVIKRHYPKITETWLNASSAFSVWDAPPNAENPVPLYLRVPH
ncbi:Alpha-dioxygenase 1 [Nymphaea thermarum]|nr:Alpha-dioxygenase 1 [Nymphaea thermarum]